MPIKKVQKWKIWKCDINILNSCSCLCNSIVGFKYVSSIKNKVDNTSNVANNQQQQQQVQNQPKQSVQQDEPDDSYDATGRDLSNYYYAVDYYSSNYNDSNAYLFPGSDSAYIDPEELSGCTDSQLAYIRNEIFARHGYIFKTDKYNNYFESKSWYHQIHMRQIT